MSHARAPSDRRHGNTDTWMRPVVRVMGAGFIGALPEGLRIGTLLLPPRGTQPCEVRQGRLLVSRRRREKPSPLRSRQDLRASNAVSIMVSRHQGCPQKPVYRDRRTETTKKRASPPPPSATSSPSTEAAHYGADIGRHTSWALTEQHLSVVLCSCSRHCLWNWAGPGDGGWPGGR